jgi:hypothetical protein
MEEVYAIAVSFGKNVRNRGFPPHHNTLNTRKLSWPFDKVCKESFRSNRERCARPRLKLVFLSLELVLFVREEHLHDVFVVFVVFGAVALVVFSA